MNKATLFGGLCWVECLDSGRLVYRLDAELLFDLKPVPILEPVQASCCCSGTAINVNI
jgi:hypothetical protein